MSDFLQLHLLTSYPPANLNRDDLGRPKTCTVGGVERLRISSQSLKRAWRTSRLFQETVEDPLGIRTKRIGVLVFRALTQGRSLEDQVRIEEMSKEDVPEGKLKKLKPQDAAEVTRAVASVFGKLVEQAEEPQGVASDTAAAKPQGRTAKKAAKKSGPDEVAISETDFELKQLAHLSREEIRGVSKLLEKARKGEGWGEDDLKPTLLSRESSAADIAMFGRFFADAKDYSVEAAVQVAHAFGVQRATITDDYFTAVDDLSRRDVSGASHVDVGEFDSGLFYLFVCINRDLLVQNLRGKNNLADRALRALIACAAQVAPVGKQASFASRAYASYILAEKGVFQPRSLAVAYLDPISGPGVLKSAVELLRNARKRMDNAYKQKWDAKELDTVDAPGTGTLAELQEFLAK